MSQAMKRATFGVLVLAICGCTARTAGTDETAAKGHLLTPPPSAAAKGSAAAGEKAPRPDVSGGSRSAPGGKAPATRASEAIMQKICPVMEQEINPQIFVVYKGRKVYLCCDSCVEEFKRKPEVYIKNIDDQ